MAWNAYPLELRLHGPLHIGWLVLGNVQFTRPYVPARTLWGAVTARLTRQLPWPTAKDYADTGAEVKKWLAFTYAYPVDDGRVLYPVYADGAMVYGPGPARMSAEDFAWRFLASYASTALNYPESSAHAGSLHELEYLSPWPRPASERPTEQPTRLLGYIFVDKTCPPNWWARAQVALKEFRLGGEGRYGFGRVTGRLQVLAANDRLFGLYNVDLSGDRPIILLTDEAVLLAHTQATGGFKVLTGVIEPLVGRNWHRSRGAGRELVILDKDKTCLAPGSYVTGLRQVQIGPYGIWEGK